MSKLKFEKSKLILEKAEIKEERDIAVKKLEYLPRIMNIKNSLNLEKRVKEMFKKTKATSFLLFIGVNGKTSVNHVSCIWYRYKDENTEIDAIETYRNVDITKDEYYKDMMYKVSKDLNYYHFVDTMKMPKGLLKTIYYDEEITHSIVGKLARKPIDEDNDFLMFFSLRTDEDTETGYTEDEVNNIRLIINGKIKPLIDKIQG